MFIACPQCRYLVATDPRTQSAPARCTRCGAALQPDAEKISPTTPTADDAGVASGGQSLASLLRRDDEAADAPEILTSTVEVAESEPALSEPGQEMSVQDNEVVALAVAVAAPVRGARAPAFLRGRAATARTAPGTPPWQWLLAGALLLSLLLQMLLADRARLAADAGWRPLLSTLCQTLGCSLPAWREPQAFVMLDRDVRPLPNVAGVLQARATFRNDARWSQPWPILLLTLKDADGRDLGARAITPAEYLRGSTAMGELAPGQSAQVAVTLREPSANVVAFSFDFR